MIELKNITKKYNQQFVYNNFSLSLQEGKITCILGASGCGKTTLLKILAGLENFSGKIENFPTPLSFVFQEDRLLPNLTVKENLQYIFGKNCNIEELLTKTELTEKKNQYPAQLSGGEKRRVSLARAFQDNFKSVLLDEPFSSLDTALKIRLSYQLYSLYEKNKPTVLYVTHDLEEALLNGHRIIVLGKGKLLGDFSASNPFPRTYGEENALRQKILSLLL